MDFHCAQRSNLDELIEVLVSSGLKPEFAHVFNAGSSAQLDRTQSTVVNEIEFPEGGHRLSKNGDASFVSSDSDKSVSEFLLCIIFFLLKTKSSLFFTCFLISKRMQRIIETEIASFGLRCHSKA